MNNLLITVPAFPRFRLTSLSVDNILQPWYVDWSTNIKVERTPARLKGMNTVVLAFT